MIWVQQGAASSTVLSDPFSGSSAKFRLKPLFLVLGISYQIWYPHGSRL